MARHSWLGGGNRSVDIARVTDNPVEVLTELDGCSEKLPVRIGPMRPGVGEINRLRPPVAAQELLGDSGQDFRDSARLRLTAGDSWLYILGQFSRS
jgi:hypothetical protein